MSQTSTHIDDLLDPEAPSSFAKVTGTETLMHVYIYCYLDSRKHRVLDIALRRATTATQLKHAPSFSDLLQHEVPECGGAYSPAKNALHGGETGVIPPLHSPFLHEPAQVSLAQDGAHEVHTSVRVHYYLAHVQLVLKNEVKMAMSTISGEMNRYERDER